MLHPQFREIIQYINSENISIIMETNGTLIDDEMALFLKSTPHFAFVSISVDGANAKTHDDLRGIKNSFQQAVHGIESLVKAGFRPQLICTLHKGNVAELEDVVALAESLGCDSVKFNHIQRLGRGTNFSEGNGLSVNEIISLFEKTEVETRKKFSIAINFDIPQAFFPINKLLHGSNNRCAIKNILGVLSGGEIALCGIGVTIPELVFGSIGMDPIGEVWVRHDFLKKLRKQIPSGFSGICHECLFCDTCIGSCVANNYHQARKLTASYYFCEEAEKQGLFPKNRKKSNSQGAKNEKSKNTL